MIDLHTHSCFSDGTLTPTQLVKEAEKLGLSAIALTDHNTVEGLPEFMTAGEHSAVTVIPGIEFSTEYENTELHMIALFVAEAYYPLITARMEDFRRRKEQSNRDLVTALQQEGLHIDYEKIHARSEGYVNRAVIAAELTELGYAATIQEAFKKYLNPDRGYYIPTRRMDAYEAITFIKSIGAVAVLAHPFLNLSEAALRRFLPQAVDSGLDAMETMYPKYDEQTTRLARQIAAEMGLLQSGGSDFHGKNKPDIFLGTGRGTLKIPDLFLMDLFARKNTA